MSRTYADEQPIDIMLCYCYKQWSTWVILGGIETTRTAIHADTTPVYFPESDRIQTRTCLVFAADQSINQSINHSLITVGETITASANNRKIARKETFRGDAKFDQIVSYELTSVCSTEYIQAWLERTARCSATTPFLTCFIQIEDCAGFR